MSTQALPVGQLESLRFKAEQIIESIQALQRTLEAGGQNVMPTWPEILTKYNILLSQTHNFSTSLLAPVQSGTNKSRANGTGTHQQPSNPFQRLVLHPTKPMPDAQLDNDLIPLLRNQQTTQVLHAETDTVRRLSERMVSRGSLGVLTGAALPGRGGGEGMEYDEVLRECDAIRTAHDSRVERAVRAVSMLRDKYDWKVRVKVDQEEPEELDWDPRMRVLPETNADVPIEDVTMDTPVDAEDDGEGGGSSDDDEELENVIGGVTGPTPGTDDTDEAGATPPVS